MSGLIRRGRDVGVRRVAAIISKTSGVAHSRTDFQAGSRGTRFCAAVVAVTTAVLAFVPVTKRLPGAGPRVLLLARG
jgi:hypothetical protein